MSATPRTGTGRSAEFADSAPGSSPVQLVEQKILVADATDVTFAGLNGDADVTYELNIQSPQIINNSNWIMYMNADLNSAHYFYQFMKAINNAVSAGPNSPSGPMYFLTQDSGGSAEVVATMKIFAKSGKVRTTLTLQQQGGMSTRYWSGQWTNSVDSITDLTIHSDQVLGIKAGTIMTLYKWPNG